VHTYVYGGRGHYVLYKMLYTKNCPSCGNKVDLYPYHNAFLDHERKNHPEEYKSRLREAFPFFRVLEAKNQSPQPTGDLG
jgi:hypothetical protein